MKTLNIQGSYFSNFPYHVALYSGTAPAGGINVYVDGQIMHPYTSPELDGEQVLACEYVGKDGQTYYLYNEESIAPSSFNPDNYVAVNTNPAASFRIDDVNAAIGDGSGLRVYILGCKGQAGAAPEVDKTSNKIIRTGTGGYGGDTCTYTINAGGNTFSASVTGGYGSGGAGVFETSDGLDMTSSDVGGWGDLLILEFGKHQYLTSNPFVINSASRTTADAAFKGRDASAPTNEYTLTGTYESMPGAPGGPRASKTETNAMSSAHKAEKQPAPRKYTNFTAGSGLYAPIVKHGSWKMTQKLIEARSALKNGGYYIEKII